MANEEIKPGTPLNDVPILGIISRSLVAFITPIWHMFAASRWAMTRPLGTTILPKCFPSFATVPFLKHIAHFSYGELLFTAPLALVLYLSINDSFLYPNVKKSGVTASYAIYAIYLTANKSNSVITFVLGIPFTRLIKWHQVWSILAIVASALHLYTAYTLGEDISLSPSAITDDDVFAANANANDEDRMLGSGSGSGSGDGNYSIHALNGEEPNLIQYCFDSSQNFSGTMALLAMAALVIPSLASILRRWFFELWYIPHIALALAVGIFLILHGIVEVGIFLGVWMLDLVVRYAIMAGRLYPHEASIRSLPGNIVELSFPKPTDGSFQYDAGQFIMIAIPQIAFSQFHPFSISSSPNDDVVTLHIKAVGPDSDTDSSASAAGSGSWTRRLLNLAKSGVDNNKVNFMMEGPYGNLAVDLSNRARYKMVLMISGGIGVTPMQSIANTLLSNSNSSNGSTSHIVNVDDDDHSRIHVPAGSSPDDDDDLKKIKFVWTAKSLDVVKAMKDSATYHGNDTHISIHNHDDIKDHNVLDMDIFITGRSESDSSDDDLEKKSLSNVKITYSRPLIDSIFQEMKQSAIANDESVVAVLVCGPVGLIDACRGASRRWSDSAAICKKNGSVSGSSVKFDFHEEKFAF